MSHGLAIDIKYYQLIEALGLKFSVCCNSVVKIIEVEIVARFNSQWCASVVLFPESW